jgi:hypothetical protein
MRKSALRVALWVSLIISLVPGISGAQTNDQVVSAAKRLAENWQALIQKQVLLLSPCAEAAWRVTRFSSSSSVAFDVKKTDSLVSPYVGIIRITGSLESNGRSSHANGFVNQYTLVDPTKIFCFKTPEEALHDNEFSLEFGSSPREYVATYNFDGSAFVLADGNEQFHNGVLEALRETARRNAPSVDAVMRVSVK